ncbi:hypothetical protein B0H11DRAFT_2222109 [Mycena galericulata]|nr:hypothetical protein B0H11DRAFT_2222109 [Mycena galericulata]
MGFYVIAPNSDHDSEDIRKSPYDTAKASGHSWPDAIAGPYPLAIPGAPVTSPSDSITAVNGDASEALDESFWLSADASPDEFPFAVELPHLNTPDSETASRDAYSPGILPLVRTWDLLDPWVGLDNAPGDPLLKLLYRIALGPGCPFRALTDDDIESTTYCGIVTFYIRPTYLEQLYDALERLSAVIRCAGNDFFPAFGGGLQNAPMGLNVNAVNENDGCTPGILLFGGYSVRRMNDKPGFATRAEAIDFAVTAQKIWVYYMHWLTNVIINSHEHDYCSYWNPGAAINMARTEFTQRINGHAFYGGGQSVRRLMDNLLYANAMDYLCAQFLSKFTRRLILIERRGSVSLTMWPVPKQSSLFDPIPEEPADQLVQNYLADEGLTIADLDDEVMRMDCPDHCSKLPSSLFEVRILV